MKIYEGQFVLIKDEFLDKYFKPIKGADGTINKINHGKGRPFFYVFDETQDIAWVVPVSSDQSGKLKEKYYNYKPHETKEQPNWLALGKVDDKHSVFKLSGMFPVPKNMIKRVYYSKRYGLFPMAKIESKKIASLAKSFENRNETNLKRGLPELIDSPYKEILKDCGITKSFLSKSEDEPEVEEDEKEFGIE